MSRLHHLISLVTRILASGALSALVVFLSWMNRYVFVLGFGPPYLIILPVLLIPPVQRYVSRIGDEYDVEGPTLFIVALVTGSFLFWWAVIFTAWTLIRRRRLRGQEQS
jgi:hypothetical protein